MMRYTYRLLSLVLAFLYAGSVYSEGFVAGTLIKTPSGYTAIEKLHVGDSVICYDFKNRGVERPVTRVIKKHTDVLVQLTIASELISVAPDHTFYLPRERKWVAAQDLTPDHVLLSHCAELVSIDDIQVIPYGADVYDITVAGCHNFCVSQHEIHVHNFAPFVIVGISWAFGAGVGGGLAVTGTLGIGALAIGAVLYNSEHRQREYIYTTMELEAEAQRRKHRCDPLNPTHTDCYYEDVSYHHLNSKGGQQAGKSRAPKDGLGALRNSVRVDETSRSPRRIGISQGEFVVLDYTCHDANGNCKFHGHVRDWNDLEDDMKQALVREGAIKLKGKRNSR
jgi:hypothetical protein